MGQAQTRTKVPVKYVQPAPPAVMAHAAHVVLGRRQMMIRSNAYRVLLGPLGLMVRVQHVIQANNL